MNWLIKLEDDSGPYSVILLRPDARTDNFSEADLKIIEETGTTIISHDLFLGFDNRTVEWHLQHYLPHIENIISSYEAVGHIAHMNLRGDDMLAAKYLMGAIVLEVRFEAQPKTNIISPSASVSRLANIALTDFPLDTVCSRIWNPNCCEQGRLRR